MAISMTMIIAIVLIAGLLAGVSLLRCASGSSRCAKCGRKCDSAGQFCPHCGGEVKN